MKADSISEPPQTRDDFLKSLFEAYAKARPLSFLRQWRPEDLIASGIPRDWLQENHLLKTDGESADLPSWCSQRKFSEIATRTFGRAVNQSSVGRAIRSEGMASCVTATNGRIRTDAGLQWWRVNKTTSIKEAATEAEHRRERQRIAREREQMELDESKRRFDKRWMLADAFNFWIDGITLAMRQAILDALKRALDATHTSAKESGLDDAATEKIMTALRPKLDASFASWQVDFCGDEATGKLGRLDELDKTCWELSEQKKTQL